MIVMTLNYRGLAIIPKKLAVRRLIDEHFIYVLFLQETMCDGVMLVAEMDQCLKMGSLYKWNVKVNPGEGDSFGLEDSPFSVVECLGYGLPASLYLIELKMALCCVNLYGPKVDRESFWINLLKMEFLKSCKLILGRYMNSSVGFI